MSTGPEGYETNYRAIGEFLAFAPAILAEAVSRNGQKPDSACSLFMVMAYHIERTTRFGRPSEQTSQGAAVTGIYDRIRRQWVRGPVGVSVATWKRANAALSERRADDPEAEPGECGLGLCFLRRLPRFTTTGGCAGTEYVIDWLRIRNTIAQWQTQNSIPSDTPLLDSTTNLLLAHGEPGGWLTVSQGVAHGEPGRVAHGEPGGIPFFDAMSHTRAPDRNLALTKEEVSGCSGSTRAEPETAPTTHPNPESHAHLVQVAVENAIGRGLFANDPIPGQLLAMADKLSMPVKALCRWIGYFAERKRKTRGFVFTSPRLFVRAAETELLIWCRINSDFIAQCRREEGRPEQLGLLVEMPAEPEAVWEVCPVCKQESILAGEGMCRSEQCVETREGKRKGVAG